MSNKIQCNLQLGLTIGTCLLFLVVMFINFSASQPQLGVFRQSTGNVSDTYSVFITPAGWTFALWGIIYTWMAVAFAYALTQLCRRNAAGSLYQNPVTLSPLFWLLLAVNMMLNVGWLFLWDWELMTACSVVLWLIAGTNWLVMATLHRRMYQARDELVANSGGSRLELGLLIGCVINGLAVYATWTTIAALLNTDIALVHVAKFSNEISSSVILAILCTIILVWFILEATVLDKYSRWTLSPGFTLVWAAVGIYSKNYVDSTPLSTRTLIAVVLAEACLLLVARLTLLVVYHCRYPWLQQQNKVSVASAGDD